MTTTTPPRTLRPMVPVDAPDFATLAAIEQRVLWLSTYMVHHANHIRPNPEKMKVGGHQASSASVVSILTMLFFHYLRGEDRVAIKPHAGPAYHAIQYLLGALPPEYLTELRAYKGIQAYPSRTKDRDRVDFSTGSVGLGAVAPAFAALTHRYASAHFADVAPRRFVALMGDAELDEGNVWEAVVEPALHGIGNVLWIVDLNRQSLDRVVPGVRAAQLKRLFAESGWNVIEAKYGARLQAVFEQPGGQTLRRCIDEMPNEAYQHLIRQGGAHIRQRLLDATPDRAALAGLLRPFADADLPALVANLGGHDLPELARALAAADASRDRPTVLFAYTIKGWGLPIAADQMNHAAQLTPEQIAALAPQLGASLAAPWAACAPGSDAAHLCAQAAARMQPPAPAAPAPLSAADIPASVIGSAGASASTQEAFGRVLARLAEVPQLAKRIVTTAPDVATSTNLVGWINKTGVFAPAAETIYDADDAPRLLRWRPGPQGQHIELGISEMNLFMLLGQLGLAAELTGELLLPIGTVYDPFVCRGLDALIYGLYSGAKFIFAGTPSGVTLAPEGGAHQSTVTPGLGITLPNLHAYEPCFALETEWVLLEALRQCCDRAHGASTYLRLSTRTIDQALLAPALAQHGSAALRGDVLRGGYRLLEGRAHCPQPEPGCAVYLAASGAVLPDVVAAARLLQGEGIAATVLNLTSADRLFHGWQAARGRDDHQIARLIPPQDRRVPIVTVQDGAAHTLAWLGSVYGAPVTPLGVDSFGQSGTRADLYRHFGLDSAQIADVAFAAVERALGEGVEGVKGRLASCFFVVYLSGTCEQRYVCKQSG